MLNVKGRWARKQVSAGKATWSCQNDNSLLKHGPGRLVPSSQKDLEQNLFLWLTSGGQGDGMHGLLSMEGGLHGIVTDCPSCWQFSWNTWKHKHILTGRWFRWISAKTEVPFEGCRVRLDVGSPWTLSNWSWVRVHGPEPFTSFKTAEHVLCRCPLIQWATSM